MRGNRLLMAESLSRAESASRQWEVLAGSFALKLIKGPFMNRIFRARDIK